MTTEDELAGTVDLNTCRALATLEREKQVLEEKTKLVEAKIRRIWKIIYPQLVGRKSQHLEGGVRLQPKRSLLVSKRAGVSTEEVVAALKKNDEFSWVVRENYQPGKLKEFVGERDRAAMEAGDIPDKISDLLPPELAPYFQIIEKNSVVVYGVKSQAKADVAAELKQKESEHG